ncbi:MAG: T9SS type A sorting domain-containing protein [Chitinophagaceae bacterium]|nr:T9SS type A sorting domain-containing protein [Chitinophagaceae bacterium]
MKKIIIIGITFLTSYNLSAQSIQRSVIGSAGKVSVSGLYKLSSTLGEALTKKVTDNNLILNQGFQQSKLASTPLPITGLEFSAIRLDNSQVQLSWKTQTEINNKGFYVERQFAHEDDFSIISYEESKAEHGTSYSALNYSQIDNNAFTGSTYYRLKQEDLDGKFTHSLTRVISGSTEKISTIKAWPQPSKGTLSILTSGLDKPDELQVLTINGQIIQQHKIENNKPLQIALPISGMYILRLSNHTDMNLKIINQ